jgi:hypothetical protein
MTIPCQIGGVFLFVAVVKIGSPLVIRPSCNPITRSAAQMETKDLIFYDIECYPHNAFVVFKDIDKNVLGDLPR